MSLGLEIPDRNRKRTASRDLVWPPWAEPAFVQAVLDYFRLHGQLSPGAGRRAQNKFIAERFLFYTGLVRSRTQVSSHLQQRRGWFRKHFGTEWDDAILALPAPVESSSPGASVSPPSSSSTPSASPSPVACTTLPNVCHRPMPPQLSAGADAYLRLSALPSPWSSNGYPEALSQPHIPSSHASPYEERPTRSLYDPPLASRADYAWSSGAYGAHRTASVSRSFHEFQSVDLEFPGPFIWSSSF
ncbi:hypothetical protein AURDEDRAFT_159529 [Auricularia subglabra TFB-10046 SS5]|nr:hypothetical protein AURDEDRAFT_159529 [Auricularia subglabra TFB-10046 SS5]